MALTLAEAAKYSNDILQIGVVELIVQDDPILEKLQFKTIKGNGLTYNVETTMSGAQFYSVGDTWVESTSTVTQTTATTTILGGDADVDNFLKATRSDLQDLMGEQITAKTKAIREKFLDTFWYGNTTYNSKEFNGIHSLVNSETYNTVPLGTNNTTPVLLNLAKLEEAVDLVKGDKPDIIMMAKGMRRSINKYLNGVGGITKGDVQGKTVQTLFDIPVGVSDNILITENCDKAYTTYYGFEYTTPAATSDGATSIFVLKFAPESCCGIQSLPITVEKLGNLETKDASRVRIKWYPGLMLQKIITVAKVTGIDWDGTVAA
jgi:hypothetical protein